MKVAVCFSGQLRAGLSAIPAIKCFIDSLWGDCDFFVHTWDTQFNKTYCDEVVKKLSDISDTEIIYKRPDSVEWIPTPASDIEKIISEYNVKLYEVENFNSVSDRIEELRKLCVIPNNLPKGQDPFPPFMYYSYYRSVELAKKYELANGFNYDIIVKLRPDAVLYQRNLENENQPPNIFRSLRKDIQQVLDNPDTIYTSSDLYWIGTGETIKKVNSFWEEGTRQAGISFWNYCSTSGINVIDLGGGYGIPRNLWRNIPVDDFIMLELFERFFLNLPLTVDHMLKGLEFNREELVENFKACIIKYGILQEFCAETGATTLAKK